MHGSDGFPALLLHELALNRAERAPAATALLDGDTRLDYGALATEIRRTAAALRALGVAPGERIAVHSPKRSEAVIAFFAASLAGAVLVPLHPTLKPAQIRHILADCAATILVTTAAGLAAFREAPADSVRHVIVMGDEAGVADSSGLSVLTWQQLPAGPTVMPSRIDTDVAAILYTSGSTGRPKGVVLTHRNLLAGAASVNAYLEHTSDDVLLAVLPFSFDAGFSQLTTAFASGACVALTNYLVPADVLRALESYPVTGLAGVPSLWAPLSRLPWPDAVTTRLRYVTNTGGPMPGTTLGRLRALLPHTRIFLMYGLTEAFRSTYLPPEQLDHRPLSIGKAIPNTDVRVLNDAGAECAPGEHGELVHRGSLVAQGYWNDPERTARRFRPLPATDGRTVPEMAVWSGDTVYRDDEGFLYFVGRRDDMIKSSGFRISPAEVEEAAYGAAAVTECAAVGVAHAELGQAVVLVCTAAPADAEAEEAILAACRRSLPGYMVPRAIVFRDSLPRTTTRKIDRRALADSLAAHFADVVA